MAKSQNCLDVNWGPWSDWTMSGAPVRQNLSSEVRGYGVTAHVNNVEPVGVAVNGQSVWQSTTRKMCPACEQ